MGPGEPLQKFDDISRYRLPEFRSTFRLIVSQLAQLKRQVLEFERYFRTVNPGYSHHENFYAMLNGFVYDRSRGFWSEETRGDAPKPSHQVLMELIDRMSNHLNPLLRSAENHSGLPIYDIKLYGGPEDYPVLAPDENSHHSDLSRNLDVES